MKKRVTYRPSKANGVFGGVVGGIFVLIGIFVVIPTFGLFGILWTFMAAGMAGVNLYHAFGKGYVGPRIEIEDTEDFLEPSSEERFKESPEERLKKLQSLYDQRLITWEEYEKKRKEIIEAL